MSSYKPRTFRSENGGCCICGSKSSSSRFTNSTRFEAHFRESFLLEEKRSGDICNACVLLVKRKLKGSANSWHHVVDSKKGPGVKNISKIKKKYNATAGARRSDDSMSDTGEGPSSGSRTSSYRKRFQNQRCRKWLLKITRNSRLKCEKTPCYGFMDTNYWTKKEVCCGVIYEGPDGKVIVPEQMLSGQCKTCRERTSKSNEQEAEDAQAASPSQSEESEPVTPQEAMNGEEDAMDVEQVHHNGWNSDESADEFVKYNGDDSVVPHNICNGNGSAVDVKEDDRDSGLWSLISAIEFLSASSSPSEPQFGSQCKQFQPESCEKA